MQVTNGVSSTIVDSWEQEPTLLASTTMNLQELDPAPFDPSKLNTSPSTSWPYRCPSHSY